MINSMQATLSFIENSSKWEHEKPYELIGFTDLEIPNHLRSNLSYEVHTVNLIDLREVEKPSLQQHGFTWPNHPSKHITDRTPFVRRDEDRGAVKDYLEETLSLVKTVVGASRGYVYDWRVRENGVKYENGQPATDPKTSRYYLYAPIGDVHTDFSHRGALDRIRLHLCTEEMRNAKQDGLKTVLINAWRPLKKVTNAPLGVCDRRTVMECDVVPVDKVLPENAEEETCVRYSPSQQWYYLSEQEPEEILLFVQWEDNSQWNEGSISVPHGALGGPGVNTGGAPRESLEVRMILLV